MLKLRSTKNILLEVDGRKYYKTSDNQYGYVDAPYSIPPGSTEITEDQYNSWYDQNKSKLNSLSTTTYSWEGDNLKGVQERMPPVEYNGQVMSKPGSVNPEQWGQYMGVLGDYNKQMEEHTAWLRKWFKDNAPGDDYYKNNMFYYKGSDGLPVYNESAMKNYIPGLHPEESAEYHAKKNTILSNHNSALTTLKQNHDSINQRYKSDLDQVEKDWGQPETPTNYEDVYNTGAGKYNAYDTEGGLGATLKSPTSGGVSTGDPNIDSWIKFTKPTYEKKREEVLNKMSTESTSYKNKIKAQESKYNNEIKKLDKEYLHPEFNGGIGITKEELKLYNQLSDAQKKKWDEINKDIRKADSLAWAEYNRDEQTPGLAGQPGFDTGSESWKLRELVISKAEQPVTNWSDDPEIKKQTELQKIKLKTTDLMISQLYQEDLDLLAATFGAKTSKQKYEEEKENASWYDVTYWDVHDWLLVASVACFLVPGLQGVALAGRGLSLFGAADAAATALSLGLTDAALLSSAIDLLDAGIYVSEDNWKSAGLSVLFAFVPIAVDAGILKGVGSKGVKIITDFLKSVPDAFLKANGQMTMRELYEYTKVILDAEVQNVIKKVSQKSADIIDLMNTASGNILKTASEKIGASTIAKSTATVVKVSAKGMVGLLKFGTKSGLVLAGYGGMAIAYDYGVEVYQENIAKSPRTVIEEGGFPWESLKSEFGSDGSANDNNLLKQAFLLGWRPGMPIPTEFQTTTYKQRLVDQKKQKEEEFTGEDALILINDFINQNQEKIKEEKKVEIIGGIKDKIENNDKEVEDIRKSVLDKWEKVQNKEDNMSETQK